MTAVSRLALSTTSTAMLACGSCAAGGPASGLVVVVTLDLVSLPSIISSFSQERLS